jgi:hypothetical protein
MPEDETPDDSEPTDDESPSEPTSDDEPMDRDEELNRLYERIADLEDDVRGSRASKESVAELRDELDAFEADVASRTVDRESMESELKRYVRRRVRRGKAHGWGPYLVLLYGTIMTIAVIYSPFLGDGWAIFGMVVIWLSTLGLYVLMVLFGVVFNVLGLPGRLYDHAQQWRS